jgi:hypothetical protein
MAMPLALLLHGRITQGNAIHLRPLESLLSRLNHLAANLNTTHT